LVNKIILFFYIYPVVGRYTKFWKS